MMTLSRPTKLEGGREEGEKCQPLVSIPTIIHSLLHLRWSCDVHVCVPWWHWFCELIEFEVAVYCEDQSPLLCCEMHKPPSLAIPWRRQNSSLVKTAMVMTHYISLNPRLSLLLETQGSRLKSCQPTSQMLSGFVGAEIQVWSEERPSSHQQLYSTCLLLFLPPRWPFKISLFVFLGTTAHNFCLYSVPLWAGPMAERCLVPGAGCWWGSWGEWDMQRHWTYRNHWPALTKPSLLLDWY